MSQSDYSLAHSVQEVSVLKHMHGFVAHVLILSDNLALQMVLRKIIYE